MATVSQKPQCPFSRPENLFRDLSSLRKQDGLEYSEVLQCPVVSRYDDITYVLERPDLFSSRATVPTPPDFIVDMFANKVPLRGTLLGWDNPDHDRLRASVSSFFVPRRLVRFQPLIEKLAHELIDGFVQDGSVDIRSRFALPLPLKVIIEIAGLDSSRWEWIGKSLALFGGLADMSAGTSFEEQIQDVLDLHAYVAELIQLRKEDRRDDLISHIWDQRDSGVVEMTDFEHLAMIPGLLLAGHETTTSLLSMGLAHLIHHGLWDQINQSDEKRADAIEELLRYESAITGMKREVTQKTSLANTDLNPGDVIFVAYNSGSRDSKYFKFPDTLEPEHKAHSRQHLGFGRGMHACLGAPLARLLLRLELGILHKRLKDLHLSYPYEDIEYDSVHEARGIKKLVVGWNVTSSVQKQLNGFARKDSGTVYGSKPAHLNLVVHDIAYLTTDIIQLDLRPPEGQKLPKWTPGAHVDIPVGKLGYRQYSICSNPEQTGSLQVAVLREVTGAGGSRYIHDRIRPGMTMSVGGPRNHFPFREASKYLFVAGGIGITPILPMMEAAKAIGADYRLVYLGSGRKNMAFVNSIEHHPQVTLWPKDERGSFNLSSLTDEVQEDHLVYCCGPERLLNAVEKTFEYLPPGSVIVERFNNKNLTSRKPNTSFDVVMNRSGKTLHVPKDRSLLDIINENGGSIMSTCARGTCGTCEVGVVQGVPDHRDNVLTAAEKLENKSMMPCVSRCIGDKLILDLW